MSKYDSLTVESLNDHSLNPTQRQAVKQVDGSILVLAGAGTGKTKVLTSRIQHLIQDHSIPPHQILAVTFTNKAAQEIGRRLEPILSVPLSTLWIGTFHALSARILRRHAELCGLLSNFSILDDGDQLRLIKQILKESPSFQKIGLSEHRIQYFFDQWKNKYITDLAVHAKNEGLEDLFLAYQQRLLDLNACDFSDLLLHCVDILQKNSTVLKLYHQRFRYILVDEYQDINTVQYCWLRLLAQGYGNIFCVGDEDQSIYSWRGADVSHILRFEHDFPNAKLIRLEQNYRSTQSILNTASHLIANNRYRLGKTLWSQIERGDKVRVTRYWDGKDEASRISHEIAIPPKQIFS